MFSLLFRYIKSAAKRIMRYTDSYVSRSVVEVSDRNGSKLGEKPLTDVVVRRAVSVLVGSIGAALVLPPFVNTATATPLSQSFMSIATEMWRGGL